MSKLNEILGGRRPKKPEYYSLERLVELIEPQDRDELIMALGQLVRNGTIKSIVRVVDPATQGGIGDFPSINEVPPVIFDFRSGMNLEVKPEDLRFLYVVPATNDD